MLERGTLFLTVTGTILFGCAVWHMLQFNMRGRLWVYLLISSMACWVIAACVGSAHQSPTNDD